MSKGITPAFLAIASALVSACDDTPQNPSLIEEEIGAASVASGFNPTNEDALRDILAKHKHCSLEDGSLRVNYVGYDRGSERVVITRPLPGRGEKMTLCYDVRFPAGFDFAKGGKLHGLGPDKPVTGGAEMRPDGWSARVTFTTGGGIATYLYRQDKSKKYGVTNAAKRFRFAADEWHAVTLQVSLNTPGESDGSVALFVDGSRLVASDRVPFRSGEHDSSLISKLLFSTFHGGHTPDFAPRDSDGKFSTEHAHFDNFAVHGGMIVRLAPLDR